MSVEKGGPNINDSVKSEASHIIRTKTGRLGQFINRVIVEARARDANAKKGIENAENFQVLKQNQTIKRREFSDPQNRSDRDAFFIKKAREIIREESENYQYYDPQELRQQIFDMQNENGILLLSLWKMGQLELRDQGDSARLTALLAMIEALRKMRREYRGHEIDPIIGEIEMRVAGETGQPFSIDSLF